MRRTSKKKERHTLGRAIIVQPSLLQRQKLAKATPPTYTLRRLSKTLVGRKTRRLPALLSAVRYASKHPPKPVQHDVVTYSARREFSTFLRWRLALKCIFSDASAPLCQTKRCVRCAVTLRCQSNCGRYFSRLLLNLWILKGLAVDGEFHIMDSMDL